MTPEQAEVVERVRANMSAVRIAAHASKHGRQDKSIRAAKHAANTGSSLDDAASMYGITINAVKQGWRCLFGKDAIPMRLRTTRTRIINGVRRKVVLRDGIEGYMTSWLITCPGCRTTLPREEWGGIIPIGIGCRDCRAWGKRRVKGWVPFDACEGVL